MKPPPCPRGLFSALCLGIACLFLGATSEPRLGIQRQGNQINLSISNALPGSVVEGATNLSPGSPWQDAVALTNNQLTATLDATGAMRFFRLRAPETLPPDPATVAPPLSQTSFPDLASSTEFLYTGANPIQTGVTNGAISPVRASVLRGRVLQRDGSPLPGVRISVLGWPQFGQTLSRADGWYDLAVNGGAELRVNFEKTAYLPAQRSLYVHMQDYNSLSDLFLLQFDPVVTTVTFGTGSTGAIARGSTQTDSDGTRTATLIVPPNTRARLVLPNGTTQEVSTLHIRATEFTVGSNGPATMPAPLPPSSGYTYAVGLGADEEIATGASTVLFDQPVPFYMENFLGFPVGARVPSAYYDRERAAWIPTPDGMVIRIVQVIDNLAQVDADGDGLADADQGASIGITEPERERLTALYPPGQTLWRIAIHHLSPPYDFNHPISDVPTGGEPRGRVNSRDKVQDPSTIGGYGTLDVENQVFRENIPIVGTPFSLTYRSDEAGGDLAADRILIQLSSTNILPELDLIELTVSVAGRTFVEEFPPSPNQSYLFTWDGRDAYGRVTQAQTPATIKLDYIYDLSTGYERASYAAAASFALASGLPLTSPNVPVRHAVRSSQMFTRTLGSFSRKHHGLGGWSLSVHHSYDPIGRTLYMGNGERRTANAEHYLSRERFAGKGPLGSFAPGSIGDGGPATEALLFAPVDVTFGPDGSAYIAELFPDVPEPFCVHTVRRVTPDGIIERFAGVSGHIGAFSGDNGFATNAYLNHPTSLAVAPDGSVYIADYRNGRVRRVAPDGIITTVAESGMFPDPSEATGGDGGPATQARLAPYKIAIAPDSTLYILEVYTDEGAPPFFSYRVRRVGPDGIITAFAGTVDEGAPEGDGGPATEARLDYPRDMALGPEGSIYILESRRVRKVTPGGLIHTFAGGGTDPYGNGVAATNLDLTLFNSGLAIASDGAVFFQSDPAGGYRVTSDGIAQLFPVGGPGFCVGPDGAFYIPYFDHPFRAYVDRVGLALPGVEAGDTLIPSSDASEAYIFRKGRHERTVLALTGATLLDFNYHSDGRLGAVLNGDGLFTIIERDGSGNPTAVVAPYGQRTTLTTSNGHLASVTNPAGETTQLGYSTNGLLTSVTGPKGDEYTATYDSLGRLIRADDPAGGSTTLIRTETADGYEVQATTALGRVSRYLVENPPTGEERRLTTYPDGTQMESVRGNTDGKRKVTLPSGTVIISEEGPDPRFAMQAPVLASLTVQTPGGLINTLSTVRTATLTNRDDPFSLSNLTEAVEVNGRVATLTYLGSNRTFIATTPEGRSSTNQIDALGRVLLAQQAGLHPTRFTYDALGRLTNLVAGSGADLRSARFSYDSLGRLQTTVNPLNQSSRFDYDAADRLTQQHLPGARTISVGYDPNGRTTSVTPPGKPAHRFTNNIVNLLARYTPPDVDGATHAESYHYDADRDSTNVVRPDGQAIALTYDAAGRVRRTDYPNLDTLIYSYHPTSGLLTNVASADGGSLTFSPDGELLTNQTWSGAVTGTVSFRYDRDFRVTTQMVNGVAIPFAYDRDNLLTNVGSLRLTYQPQNGLLSTTTLGDVSDARTYNAFGELASYNAAYNGAPLYAYALARDALGRITNKTETILGETVTYDYAYDEANRLREVRTNGLLAASYAYDPNGNRLQRTNGLQTTAYTYDARDRMRQRTVGAQVTEFAWTPNGELRTQTVAGASTTYTYDPCGNLRQVLLPNATQIEYLVDGASRRIGKKVNGTLVKGFLYQGALSPIAELDASGNMVSRFLSGHMIKEGTTYRVLTDHLGSPRFVVNATNGAIVQRIDYDEFGIVLADSNPGFQPFGFAGGLYDPDTGLVRFGARDYEAQTGGWTDRDPILFAGGQPNLYAYTYNDPVNFIDPLGLGPAPQPSSDRPRYSDTERELLLERLLRRQELTRRIIESEKQHLDELEQTLREAKRGIATEVLDRALQDAVWAEAREGRPERPTRFTPVWRPSRPARWASPELNLVFSGHSSR